MMSDEAIKQAYREAYERWRRDLDRLHRVLLDGELLDPMHRIALLRSESHSHDQYEAARRRFLGIDVDDDSPPSATEGEALDA